MSAEASETWTIPREDRAVGEARRCARKVLAGWGVDDDGDTVQMVSEAITNALVHTERGPITFTLARDNKGRVWGAVMDFEPGMPHLVPSTPSDDEHHRGLFIIGLLATRWGVRKFPGELPGKTVWWCRDPQDPKAAP